MGEFFGAIFAGIGALFVLGTMTFWVASIVLFGLLTWFTEDDKDVLALVFIGGFIWISAGVNDWSIILNPIVWLKWFVIYIAVGCAWSFIKWFSFLHKAKDRLRDLKESFGEKYLVSGKPSEYSSDVFRNFAEYLYKKGYVNDFLRSGTEYVSEEFIKKPQDIQPTVKNRFSRLVRWIVWWPMSAVWTLLNDPIKRIAEFIVRSLKTSYTKMADAVFGNEI